VRRTTAGLLLLPIAFATLGCIGNTLSAVPFHEEPTHPYYALIYVYRIPSFLAGGESWEVSLDENEVGRLFPKAYMTVHAAPGTHWLKIGEGAPLMLAITPAMAVGAAIGAAMREERQNMEFRARSGEVYYLRCDGLDREFVTRDEAMKTLPDMKYDQGN
jgi:hypothetical protein